MDKQWTLGLSHQQVQVKQLIFVTIRSARHGTLIQSWTKLNFKTIYLIAISVQACFWVERRWRDNKPSIKALKKHIHLEFREKLADNEDESARALSLADGPPIALLLTALLQLGAWYLCISPNYHRHTASSIKPLQEAIEAKLHKRLLTRIYLTINNWSRLTTL